MKGMNRRKRLKIIITLAVALCLFYLFQNLVMPKYMKDTREGALIAEYYRDKSKHDVIFIGDCEVYENFSPVTLWNEYGINSFIRGSASQTIWQSFYILEDTLRYETPQAVVFNVLSMQYGEPVSEAYNRMNIDGMKLSPAKISAARQSMTEEEHLITYLFPLFRFHSRWSELTGEDVKYLFRRDIVSYNGYLMQTGIKPVTTIPEGKPLGDYKFPDKCWEYLDKMAKLCEKKGITLILIKAPGLYPYWYEEWDIQIKNYAAENNISYYNLLETAEEAGIDYEHDTYDAGLHLNVYGAEKLSRYFGKILSENYEFSNHDNDSVLSGYFSRLTKKYEEEKKGLQQDE